MADRNFDIIAKEQFSFLQTDFKFNLVICKRDNWGYKMLYANETTAVTIIYEIREAYIFIMLYRLINGEFCENPGNITEETILNGYALDDIISIQNADALIKPAYKYGQNSEYYNEDNGLTLFTSAFAENLKKYGSKVLQGDFEVFAIADKIVKKRIGEYKI